MLLSTIFLVLLCSSTFCLPANSTTEKPVARQENTGVPSASSSSPAKIDAQSDVKYSFEESHPVSVSTKYMKIIGQKRSIFGKKVNTFLGIPYAKAPINDLRFKKTVPITQARRKPVDASEWPPHCAQPNLFKLESFNALKDVVTLVHEEFSEDCLYLNIWSPETTSKAKKPVMVWIHGGGYDAGTTGIYETEGDVLSLIGDVVVVTVNFRVGAFGYMDLDSEDVPGNMQLHDILTAMKWVKNNIENFNGDPNSITIFGQSSGAMNTALFLINPPEEKLFNRVILQSGTYTTFDMLYEVGQKAIDRMMADLGCKTNSTAADREVESEDEDDSETIAAAEKEHNETIKCLKSKSTDEIVKIQEKHLAQTTFTPTPKVDPIRLMPSEIQVTNYNTSLARRTPFADIDSILMGTNRDEATVFLHVALPEMFTLEKVLANFTTLDELRDLVIKTIAKFAELPESSVFSLTNNFFTGPKTDTTDNLVRRLVDMVTDTIFLCPNKATASDIKKFTTDKTGNNKVKQYMYRFSYRAKWQTRGRWMGVFHGMEVPYVFGVPLKRPLEYDGDDIEMSKDMMTSWAHFARTGSMPYQKGIEWPQYTGEDEEYMDLDGRNPTVGFKLHKRFCDIYKLGSSYAG